MKNTSLLAAVLFCIAGCDRASHVEPSSSPRRTSMIDLPVRARLTRPPLPAPLTIHPHGCVPPFGCGRSQSTCCDGVGSRRARLVVFVDVDDDEILHRISLQSAIEADPSPSRFAVTDRMASNWRSKRRTSDSCTEQPWITQRRHLALRASFRNPNEDVHCQMNCGTEWL